MGTEQSDLALLELVKAIVDGDTSGVALRLSVSPQLAQASFLTEVGPGPLHDSLIDRVGRYIYRGDTALHFAAAAYQAEIVRTLLRAGASVDASNCRGLQPLHTASLGNPTSWRCHPSAQVATIELLIQSGADPNAPDKLGMTPLHKAIRSRCAQAVRSLLAHGTDPSRKNKRGSTPMVLATFNTGRGGSGTPEAKAQQQEIVHMLDQALARS
jgi:ankyrin repeat protein